MDIASFTSESALNREAYKHLRDDIRRDYAGKYIVLARGKLVGAACTFDAARALVQRLEPVPEYYLVFAAEAEPDFELVYDLTGSL